MLRRDSQVRSPPVETTSARHRGGENRGVEPHETLTLTGDDSTPRPLPPLFTGLEVGTPLFRGLGVETPQSPHRGPVTGSRREGYNSWLEGGTVENSRGHRRTRARSRDRGSRSGSISEGHQSPDDEVESKKKVDWYDRALSGFDPPDMGGVVTGGNDRRPKEPKDIKRENSVRTTQRKTVKSRKANTKDPNAPRKSPSAYFLFLQRIRSDPKLAKEVFGDETETTRQSILAAAKWGSMTDDEQKVCTQSFEPASSRILLWLTHSL